MKKSIAFIFMILTSLSLLLNIILIIVFNIIDVEGQFFNSLEVAAISISFLSFIASSFFSLSVYLQSKEQGKINDSLLKKDDQYIIANYSLFDFEQEVTFFSLLEEEKKVLLEKGRYFSQPEKENCITRLVFMPTDSVNCPTYKVIVHSIGFYTAAQEEICVESKNGGLDGEYAPNILQRGYNCISVDIAKSATAIQEIFAETKYIELEIDIISVFNVRMRNKFIIFLDEEKDTSNNPDKKVHPDIQTYLVHHSNYLIQEKSILTYEKYKQDTTDNKDDIQVD